MPEDRRPPCQVVLLATPETDAPALASALGSGTVACVLLHSLPDGEEAAVAAIDALRPVAQERGAAFLIEGRPPLARDSGCDGVQVSGSGPAVQQARQELGTGAIVGAFCGASRHAGMIAAEAGADYVAFGGGEDGTAWWATPPDPDLLTWWQGLVTTPCVAAGGNTLHAAAGLAAAGADFVAVDSAIWSHPNGPAAAIDELAALIADGDNGGPARHIEET